MRRSRSASWLLLSEELAPRARRSLAPCMPARRPPSQLVPERARMRWRAEVVRGGDSKALDVHGELREHVALRSVLREHGALRRAVRVAKLDGDHFEVRLTGARGQER